MVLNRRAGRGRAFRPTILSLALLVVSTGAAPTALAAPGEPEDPISNPDLPGRHLLADSNPSSHVGAIPVTGGDYPLFPLAVRVLLLGLGALLGARRRA